MAQKNWFDFMETTHLQEYVVLANRRSFTEAARELHLTQSTLSKHVATLEREFGCELFVRDRTGIRLTQAGTTLYAQALQINRMMQQTCRLLRAAKPEPAASASTLTAGPRQNNQVRAKCAHLAEQHRLTQVEVSALVLFLEERGFKAIQTELSLSRDDLADTLACAYRKLNVTDKQAALNLMHSVAG